jgi:uncharacterized membrane protein YgdD (TMEM256/DUF423 family)
VLASDRRWLVLAGAMGFSGVALGAFGAHGLEGVLEGATDGAKRLEWWETAAQYHLIHALAIGLASFLARSRARNVAAISFALGIALFAGSLYAMALGAPRVLGAVTPFGGTAFLVGWAALVWCGARARPHSD